jgi:hypothetical protein
MNDWQVANAIRLYHATWSRLQQERAAPAAKSAVELPCLEREADGKRRLGRAEAARGHSVSGRPRRSHRIPETGRQETHEWVRSGSLSGYRRHKRVRWRSRTPSEQAGVSPAQRKCICPGLQYLRTPRRVYTPAVIRQCPHGLDTPRPYLLLGSSLRQERHKVQRQAAYPGKQSSRLASGPCVRSIASRTLSPGFSPS